MKGLVTGCGEIGNEKEHSGLCGVGGYIHRREHWLFYRIIFVWRDWILLILEGLVVPHISIPYVHIGLILLL
jgi:hypothetical protein